MFLLMLFALFVDLTLMFLFCVSKKIQKLIKSIKLKKFDRLCYVISHIELGLVSSY